MKRYAAQAGIIAAFFIVSPVIWHYNQPAAGVLLTLSGFLLIWSDHDTEAAAVVLAGAALAVCLMLMPLGPYSRPGGYYVNPNVSGSALAILLPLAISRREWFYAALIAAGLAATVSVGAILGAGAGLAYLGASSGLLGAIWGHHRRAVVCGAVAAILGATAAGGYFLASRPWWPDRLKFWETAINMIADNPLTGAGAGSFQMTQFVVGFDPGWSRLRSQVVPHAHNLYLHIGAEWGLVALAVVVAAAVAVFWASNSAARAAILTLAVHSLVDCTILFLPVLFALWMVVYIGGAFDQYNIRRKYPPASPVTIGAEHL